MLFHKVVNKPNADVGRSRDSDGQGFDNITLNPNGTAEQYQESSDAKKGSKVISTSC